MQELRATWIVHEGIVYVLAVSSGRSYASNDRAAQVTDMCGNEAGIYVANDFLADVKFSPDQNHLILASVDKTITIIDWRTGSLVEILLGHADSCFGIDVLPISQKLCSASLDNTV